MAALNDWLMTRIAILEMLCQTNTGIMTSDDAKVLASYRLALAALNGPRCSDMVTTGWGDGMLIKQIMADGAERVAHNIRACLDEFPMASHDIVEECAMCATETAQKLRAGL